ncbi:MAG: MarR family winged helix-turn-helix transcriptional regulator [Alphaproteobacteria bacterium]|nr:MarR family winged helix-turn-helix transcriptional regulator [Alphaproteobacteria bacterium]
MSDCRILSLDDGWSGPADGWEVVAEAPGLMATRLDAVVIGAASPRAVAEVVRLALPIIVRVGDGAAPQWLDAADAFVLPGDDAAMPGRLARWLNRPALAGVAELSDTAQHLASLSQEAQRLADMLARLAQGSDPAPDTPVDAALVRRLIRLRRDRDRHLPADLFGDPAWDMLLDLTAARMEQVDVPVSSLCLAAAVPTTTALRWVRSLSQAGLFVRRTDPADARRAFITLSDDGFAAMIAWLRRFAAVFAVR